MKKNKNRKRRNNYNNKQKKVIRCKILSRPVFGYEVCSKFSSRISSNSQSNCENCGYAF
jgi:hypothetical protein